MPVIGTTIGDLAAIEILARKANQVACAREVEERRANKNSAESAFLAKAYEEVEKAVHHASQTLIAYENLIEGL